MIWNALTAIGTAAVAIAAVGIAIWGERRTDRRIEDERARADRQLAEERALADKRLAEQLAHSDAQLAGERAAADARLKEALEQQRNGEWRYLEFLQVTSLIAADIFVREIPGGTRARHRSRPVDLPEHRY